MNYPYLKFRRDRRNIEQSNKYDGARRNFCTRYGKRFWRHTLYFRWCKLSKGQDASLKEESPRL